MLLVALMLAQAEPITNKTGTIRSDRLQESSGVAVSRAHPGLLWTHNDTGDGPYLYATDLRGTDRGRLRVAGAAAFDWEDIALGPCPRPIGATACLYVGDTGDNLETRAWVVVYALPEPGRPGSRRETGRTTTAPLVLRLRYPDGPRDVEALYVLPRDTALFLVSKGRFGPIRLYRVDPAAWGADTVVTATRVQNLPIVPSPGEGRWITGAAIRPDGRLVALRTLDEIYFFTPGVGGRLVPTTRPVCKLRGLEMQGEAIDFLDDSTLVLTSEGVHGRRGTIHTVRCPERDQRPRTREGRR